MKCTYRKLKESITDNTFPVLNVIDEMNYCYTAAADQFVDISDVIPELMTFNQLKAEAVVKFPSLDYDNVGYIVFESRGGTHLIGSVRQKFNGKIGSQNDYRADGTSNVDVTIVLDSKANKVYIGENSQTGSGSVSTGTIHSGDVIAAGIFKSVNGVSGYAYLKSLKLYDQSGSTDVLLAHFVPVSINGVGAVYDKVNDKVYYANEGSLGVI